MKRFKKVLALVLAGVLALADVYKRQLVLWSLSRRCSVMTAVILWRPTRRISLLLPASTTSRCS